MKTIICIILCVALVVPVLGTVAFASDSNGSPNFREMTAHEFVAEMGTGWNLGNTFDAWDNWRPNSSGFHFGMTNRTQIYTRETIWLGGQANRTTRTLIQRIRQLGFDTIRIPVTWHEVANATPAGNPTWEINALWMERVQEVVDWALEEDMFVILNTHHEERALDLGSGDARDENHPGNIFMRRIWEQIAYTFRDYDERLVFAGLNEPRHVGGVNEWNGGTIEVRRNVNHLNQVFVDTVRTSGGNNEYRFLQVPTVSAGSNDIAMNGFRVPRDLDQHQIIMGGANIGYCDSNPLNANHIPGTNISSSRLIWSVHTYSPFNWAHDGVGTYGGPGGITGDLDRVRTRATALGLPVILGEWGSIDVAMMRNPDYSHLPEWQRPIIRNPSQAAQDLRVTQRIQHGADYIREARERNMVAVWWDNGGFGTGEHTFGIIRRAYPHDIAPRHLSMIENIIREAPNFVDTDCITDSFTCDYFLAYVRTLPGVPSSGAIREANVQDITKINIANSNVTSLDGIEYFASLEVLFAQNLNFTDTALDLTANNYIRNIVVQGSNLTQLYLDGLKYLVHLNASNNNLNHLDVSENESLVGLSISRNGLGLVVGLDTLSSLEVFWAEANNFVGLNFHENAPLEVVDVRDNPLTVGAVDELLVRLDGLPVNPPPVVPASIWARARIVHGFAY